MSRHNMKGSRVIFARQALLKSGWAENTRIEFADGVISKIISDTNPQTHDTCVDTVLPALSNLHSHSFQRAMAGMTEYRANTEDNFWTWRDLMYRFANHLSPVHIKAIASLAFMEMQEAGFAAVAEFHYLHHRPDGTPYDNLAELCEQIYAAALETGIGLTHLPVLYSYGGANLQALTNGQKRFGNDLNRYLNLHQKAQAALRHLPPDCAIGMAPHSLRATSPEDLKNLSTSGPIHIHIAEQQKEVRDVKNWLGETPVAWLLDNVSVDENWCLIHATHMTENETRRLAGSGAVAGLCPITEANLGDGTFNGETYLNSIGAFGIGTDSNINISLVEELRILEYSQRLQHKQRNMMAHASRSTGETLYLNAASAGAQALHRKSGELAIGNLADIVAIDSSTPALCTLKPDQILDGFIFASNKDCITDLWSAGRHCVHNGKHIQRDEIIKNYRKTMIEVLSSL